MLIFIESTLHDRTTNEKGKVVTGLYNAIPGCYKNVHLEDSSISNVYSNFWKVQQLKETDLTNRRLRNHSKSIYLWLKYYTEQKIKAFTLKPFLTDESLFKVWISLIILYKKYLLISLDSCEKKENSKIPLFTAKNFP